MCCTENHHSTNIGNSQAGKCLREGTKFKVNTFMPVSKTSFLHDLSTFCVLNMLPTIQKFIMTDD